MLNDLNDEIIEEVLCIIASNAFGLWTKIDTQKGIFFFIIFYFYFYFILFYFYFIFILFLFYLSLILFIIFI